MKRKQTFTDWIISKLSRWLTKNSRPRHNYLCDFDRLRYEIRFGDVLLIEGRNRVSRFIRKLTQSPWTHAALYIGHLHDVDDPELRAKIQDYFTGSSDTQLLVESMLGKGTIITPLSHYQEDHIRICRPQGLSRADAQKVVSHAISRLGGRYNLRHVFDLARLLLPWSFMPRRWKSIIFDHRISLAAYDICSSMIADAFTAVKFPILPVIKKNKEDDEKSVELIQRNPRLYTPSDFDYSPYFDIIKYPFARPPYQHLPWKEGAMSIDDGEEIVEYQTYNNSSDKN